VIVDTSVWIDFFAGRDTWQAGLLAQELEDEQPVGLTDVVYTELLQAIKDDDMLLGVERQLPAPSGTPRSSTAPLAGRG